MQSVMSLLWRGSLLLLLLLPHLSQGKNDDILDESNNCNYHPEDRERNRWISASSVAACSNKTICVKEGEGITGYHNASYYHNYKPTICTGDASCKGELHCSGARERRERTRLVQDGSSDVLASATRPSPCLASASITKS